MRSLFFAAATAFSILTSAISAQALVVDGTLDGLGVRDDTGTIMLGSTIEFSPVILTIGNSGEYFGYDLVSIEDLILSTGAGNNGQTLVATDGSETVTFTIFDTIVASINSNGGASNDGWSLAGLLSVSSTGGLPSTTASFSLAGTNVDSTGFSFFIQTPPEFASEVPLPAGLPLLLAGLGGLALTRRWKT